MHLDPESLVLEMVHLYANLWIDGTDLEIMGLAHDEVYGEDCLTRHEATRFEVVLM